MIRSSRLGQLALGLLVLLAGSASLPALDITFNLLQLDGQSSPYSLTSGGYTLRFTQPNGFFTGPNGLDLSLYAPFSISKTAGATDLIFKSYTLSAVGNFNGNSLSFDLTGGTGTSNGNTFTSNTTLNYNGNYRLVGSQTVTYSPINFVAGGAADTVTFSALTFSTVPEPSTYALGAIATGVMAAIARRRKARKG